MNERSSADIADLAKMLDLHVDGVRHYLHLQIGKPLSKDLVSAPEIALDNLHREVKAAIQSLDAAQAVPEPAQPQAAWQPIETAPRDGTNILICGTGSDGYYVSDVKWDGEWMLFDANADDWTEPTFNVTHWMPLPHPPAERETEA